MATRRRAGRALSPFSPFLFLSFLSIFLFLSLGFSSFNFRDITVSDIAFVYSASADRRIVFAPTESYCVSRARADDCDLTCKLPLLVDLRPEFSNYEIVVISFACIRLLEEIYKRNFEKVLYYIME